MIKVSTRNRAILLSSLAVVTVCLVVVVVFVLIRTPAKHTETSTDDSVSEIGTPRSALTEPEPVTQTEIPVPPVTIEDLIEACPEPFIWGYNGFGVISEQCVSMLEPFFIDLPYIPKNGFQWLQFPDRITYRRIFEDPRQDRELAFDALSRAECRFEDGELIRPDLRETCHAESFYVFSSFTNICRWYWDSRDLRDYDLYDSNINIKPTAGLWEGHLSELATREDGSLNLALYTRLKQDVWHTALATHWYRRKCQEYDLESIVLDSAGRDLDYYNILTTVTERLNITPKLGDEGRQIESDTYQVMSIIAAHFGEFSASILYARERIGNRWGETTRVDSSLVAANHRQYPWLKTFRNVNKLTRYGLVEPEPLDGKWDYWGLIRVSIKGLLELDEAGVKYDFAALVDQLCRRVPNSRHVDSGFNCREAIEDLNSRTNTSFKKGLKLDEFKKIALELGVWE